jgi:hypothetical protein
MAVVPVIYAFIAAFVLGLGVGAGGMRHWDSVEIRDLEAALTAVNVTSAATLASKTAEVARATEKAKQANDQLEQSYDQSIATVNAYFDRVRASGKTRSPNPVPSCAGATTSEAATAETSPATDDAFTPHTPDFERKAYVIDEWASSCWKFVNDNCRMPQDGR